MLRNIRNARSIAKAAKKVSSLSVSLAASISASRAVSSSSSISQLLVSSSSNSSFIRALNGRRFFSTVPDQHEGLGPVTQVADIRNIAICAHVDAGKTTLVDCLLRQAGGTKIASGERVMDSNDLERERGITILSKNTSIQWNKKTLNIVDTPGHADFGGEVERVLSMVDGVCLLVDASEGVMPGTKFVLAKALQAGLMPIVVLNKVDRDSNRIGEVENEIFDLFVTLEATEEQLDFPILYASARAGWAVRDPVNDERKDMTPLYEEIVRRVPGPQVRKDDPFSMLVTTLEHDQFLGRILTGRVTSGSLKAGDKLHGLTREGGKVEDGRVLKLLSRRGLETVPLDEGRCGDIISIAGFGKTGVTDTLCATSVTKPLYARPLDPPIVSVRFSPNDSPLAGEEGTLVNPLKLRERIFREAESNVAIQVQESEVSDALEVQGRGELQIGVLIEQMRREGFELNVSPPKVLYKRDENGALLEPVEEVIIDVDDEYSGVVIEKMALRKAEMSDYKQAMGKTRLVFRAPARGLIGYRSEFKTDTHGTGVLNHLFHSYEPFKGKLDAYRKGVLISMETGIASAYALNMLEPRGILFVNPHDKTYGGMIIGEHSKAEDLEVNPCKEKQLTNLRSAGKDEAIKLSPPRLVSLEEAISYIQEDELIEVTPKSIRLRKRYLNAQDRKKYARQGEAGMN